MDKVLTELYDTSSNKNYQIKFIMDDETFGCRISIFKDGLRVASTFSEMPDITMEIATNLQETAMEAMRIMSEKVNKNDHI